MRGASERCFSTLLKLTEIHRFVYPRVEKPSDPSIVPFIGRLITLDQAAASRPIGSAENTGVGPRSQSCDDCRVAATRMQSEGARFCCSGNYLSTIGALPIVICSQYSGAIVELDHGVKRSGSSLRNRLIPAPLPNQNSTWTGAGNDEAGDEHTFARCAVNKVERLIRRPSERDSSVDIASYISTKTTPVELTGPPSMWTV